MLAVDNCICVSGRPDRSRRHAFGRWCKAKLDCPGLEEAQRRHARGCELVTTMADKIGVVADRKFWSSRLATGVSMCLLQKNSGRPEYASNSPSSDNGSILRICCVALRCVIRRGLR